MGNCCVKGVERNEQRYVPTHMPSNNPYSPHGSAPIPGISYIPPQGAASTQMRPYPIAGPSQPPMNGQPLANIQTAKPNVNIIPNMAMPTPMPQDNSPYQTVIVRALYKYEGQHADDLAFEKDDFMIVHCDRSEPWWYAEHSKSHKKGYIPSNYVVIDDGRPSSLDAWYDISRREADRLLLLMGNPRGTYIIRSCSDPRHFALSVRFFDSERNFYVVKHYKIRTLDNNGGFYISQRRPFTLISELIDYYSKNSDGLCCRLSKPCPRVYRPPVQFRDIEINRQSIKLYEKLGHGSFGEVRLGKWNDTVEVAVKLLKPNSMDRDKFIAEAELMHKLHHKQIVQILGICKDPPEEPVYIVTELMEKGALLHFLQSDEGRALKLDDLIDMMAQIADGMSYLESMNFVHRDLRAANILVGANLLVKVADFGLARVTQDTNDVYRAEEGAKFPIKWTAPEAALQRIFSVKSDVWSFGVLMYEMVTYGRTPYPSMSNRQVMDEVSHGYRIPKPEGPGINCPQDLYDIMIGCWQERPENRPTFHYLKDVFDNWSTHSEQQYLDG
jgi:hypothetical protein